MSDLIRKGNSIFYMSSEPWGISLDQQNGSVLAFDASSQNFSIQEEAGKQIVVEVDFSSDSSKAKAAQTLQQLAAQRSDGLASETEINESITVIFSGLDQPRDTLRLQGTIEIICTAKDLQELKEKDFRVKAILMNRINELQGIAEEKAQEMEKAMGQQRQAYHLLRENLENTSLLSKARLAQLQQSIATIQETIQDLGEQLTAASNQLKIAAESYVSELKTTATITHEILMESDVVKDFIASANLSKEDAASIMKPVSEAITQAVSQTALQIDDAEEVKRTALVTFQKAITRVAEVVKVENCVAHWQGLVAEKEGNVLAVIEETSVDKTIATPSRWTKLANQFGKLHECSTALQEAKAKLESVNEEIDTAKPKLEQATEEVSERKLALEQERNASSKLLDLVNAAIKNNTKALDPAKLQQTAVDFKPTDIFNAHKQEPPTGKPDPSTGFAGTTNGNN